MTTPSQAPTSEVLAYSTKVAPSSHVTCTDCGAIIARHEAHAFVSQQQAGEVVELLRRFTCQDRESCQARGPITQRLAQIQAERDELRRELGTAQLKIVEIARQGQPVELTEIGNAPDLTKIAELEALLHTLEKKCDITTANHHERLKERDEALSELNQWKTKYSELERQHYDLQQTKQPVVAKMEDVQDWLKPLADDIKRVELERDELQARHRLARHEIAELKHQLGQIRAQEKGHAWPLMLLDGEPDPEALAQQVVKSLEAQLAQAEQERDELERQARARIVREIEFVRIVRVRAEELQKDANPTRRAVELMRRADAQLNAIEQEQAPEVVS